MPTFNTTVKSSSQVWKSPDGQRTIHEVVMDYDGQEVKAKTYSDAISQVGFSGEVEVYEKQGRNGTEQFVKQAPKDNGYNPASGGGKSQAGSQRDPETQDRIVAQFAIREAVALVGHGQAAFADIETLANDLYAMVDRVRGVAPAQDDAVTPAKGDETNEDLLKDIDKVFPDAK